MRPAGTHSAGMRVGSGDGATDAPRAVVLASEAVVSGAAILTDGERDVGPDACGQRLNDADRRGHGNPRRGRRAEPRDCRHAPEERPRDVKADVRAEVADEPLAPQSQGGGLCVQRPPTIVATTQTSV